MKNTVAFTIASTMVLLLLLFTFMFDPNGMAVGSNMVTLNPIILSVAAFLGHIVWLMGVVWLVVTIVMIVMIVSTIDPNDKIFNQMSRAIDAQIDAGNVDFTPYNTRDSKGTVILAKSDIFTLWIKRPILTLMALVGIGSGFWFTGTMWLASIIAVSLFLSRTKQTFNRLREHHLTESKDERTARMSRDRSAQTGIKMCKQTIAKMRSTQ